jgi:hypothetical protein
MITRYNYEEFFLLYVDNELSAAERKAVEEFVLQNTDLEQELIMLQQSVLKPESDISFEDKDLLLKQTEENALINLTNYEEYFLLYIDNELDRSAKKDVEHFIHQHPSLQKELSLLQQAKLEPDADMVFEGKDILYKREEKKKPIPFAWLSAAAVAILLVTGFLFYNKTKQPLTKQSKDIVSRIKSSTERDSLIERNKKEDVAVTHLSSDPFNKAEDTKKKMEGNEIEKEKQTPVAQYASNYQKKKITDKKNTEVASTNLNPGKHEAQVKNERQASIAIVIAGNKKSTISSIDNPKLSAEPGSLIAKTEQPVETTKTSTESSYVTQVAMIDNPVDDIDTDNTSAKKNKLRGIFRRVSRVFEKTTNVDDGSKRSVAIGSFQIALK